MHEIKRVINTQLCQSHSSLVILVSWFWDCALSAWSVGCWQKRCLGFTLLLQFIPILFLMLALEFVGDAAQWLRRLIRQTNLAKEKKSILVFFSYQIVSLFHLTTWLHKLEHQCSKVALQLSAAPTGNGRLNGPCECSLGRWLCWGLQCAVQALGLVTDGLLQIFCFSAVC